MPAPKISEKLVKAQIAEGRGMGHGEAYQAFIQLKRWNASPVSTQTPEALYPFRRLVHFLCRSEWYLALVFAWIGCWVREQFPMWPWLHAHPLAGLPGASVDLPCSSGTIELCRRAGIKHGVWVGTDIEYIWTMDLALYLAWLPPTVDACVFVSVKPLQDDMFAKELDVLSRPAEKLEIEDRYAKELNARYFVGDRSVYPGDFLGQLEMFHASSWNPEPRIRIALNDMLMRHGGELEKCSPHDWRDILKTEFLLDTPSANYAVHHIIWHQLVDVDVSQFVRFDRAPVPGGRALRDNIRRSLMRGQHG